MNKIKYIVAVLIAIAGMGLQQAKAFESDLNAGNPAIAGLAGPYGHVSIILVNSNTATVTFTGNTVAGNTYLFGAVDAVDLNVNATTFSVSNIIGTNAGTGFTPGGFTQDVAGNVDGLGIFNLRIKSFDGFTHSSDRKSTRLNSSHITISYAV